MYLFSHVLARLLPSQCDDHTTPPLTPPLCPSFRPSVLPHFIPLLITEQMKFLLPCPFTCREGLSHLRSVISQSAIRAYHDTAVSRTHRHSYTRLLDPDKALLLFAAASYIQQLQVCVSEGVNRRLLSVAMIPIELHPSLSASLLPPSPTMSPPTPPPPPLLSLLLCTILIQ